MFTIAATYVALPGQIVASEVYDARLGLAAGTLEAKTGVAARHVVEEGESARTLACAAATGALRAAGLRVEDVDLVLGACGIALRPLPSTSAILAHDLGLRGGQVEAVDVNATCLSFLSALSFAQLRLAAGRNRCVLIVSADTPSRALPWKDVPETAALFGDGAAAVVVTRGSEWKVARERFETHPSAAFAATLASGGAEKDYHGDPEGFAQGAFFAMNGPALFKATHKALPGFLRAMCAPDHGVETWAGAAIHQASPGALTHIATQIPLDGARMPRFGHLQGNQVAASLPNALHQVLCARSFGRGDRVGLLGAGAGLHIGGMVLEHL